jgi:type IV secretory pathway TraG/TraD family ATPase VirD4
MNATKILWGQVLLVSAVALAFLWAATEWTAWKLGFQSQLGHPWFALFGWPVYQPPAIPDLKRVQRLLVVGEASSAASTNYFPAQN